MKKKIFASACLFFLCLLAAPVCFAAPGEPVFTNKPLVSLPLEKSKKSIICVNRNFYDTQKFGTALSKGLEEYSSTCSIRLGEFVPKEAVVDFDYVWTFQVKSWTDKDHDDVPEKFSALVLLYDKNFNLLLKSNIKIKKSKDPTAGNCLELLIDEWLKSIYTDIVEVSTDNEKQAE